MPVQVCTEKRKFIRRDRSARSTSEVPPVQKAECGAEVWIGEGRLRTAAAQSSRLLAGRHHLLVATKKKAEVHDETKRRETPSNLVCNKEDEMQLSSERKFDNNLMYRKAFPEQSGNLAHFYF